METLVQEKVEIKHPYIAKRREGNRNVAIIAGTGVHVWAIIGYERLGMSIEEIAKALPHLSLAQIYDAFSYYHDHQEEIEQALERNTLSDDEATLRQAKFEALFSRCK
jgi:uncharacterized protein (DUF433 family)